MGAVRSLDAQKSKICFVLECNESRRGLSVVDVLKDERHTSSTRGEQ